MMQTTKYLKLNKPDYTDVADIDDINQNMDTIDEKLNNALNHTHTLTDDDISGVLSVAKGGTGGATGAAARLNLGLGSAATMNYQESVSSGGVGLVTAGAVYDAISSIAVNNRTYIVIATYDTKNPLKSNADYVCTSENASSILKSAIEQVENGGKIELLDGTYNLQYDEDVIEISKSITIEGSGFTTAIHQPSNSADGEAKYTFSISARNVTIKNMMLYDENITSPVHIIKQSEQGTVYDGLFFIFNAEDEAGGGGCILGSGDCAYTRIQNCRVYKGFDNADKIMFDFSKCTTFSGIIGANISSGYNNISVKFANETHKNNTVLFGHINVDIK